MEEGKLVSVSGCCFATHSLTPGRPTPDGLEWYLRKQTDPVNTQEEPCCCLVTELGLGNFSFSLFFCRTEILISTPTAIAATNRSWEGKPL